MTESTTKPGAWFRAMDEFGRPCELVEVDAEAAAQWDARQWHDRPTL